MSLNCTAISHAHNLTVTSASKNARTGRHGLFVLAFALLALTGGCQDPNNGAGMSDSFYLTPYKDLTTLGRVALVELDNKSGYPSIAPDATQALFVAFQKKQVFGVTIVDHDDPQWRGLQENLDSLQALKKLLAMRETLKCNGLLVGTITQYQPYPRMSIGLRLKLIDLTDGQLLWGLEQVWDATDPAVKARIKHHFRSGFLSGASALQEEMVLVSPLQFCKFVAYEVAGTIKQEEN